ncbi:hypothetical protein AgCh_037810 [Apium graveolens]
MDGSSEFGWQRSDGSRRLNSSDVSDRNYRLLSASSIRSSGNTSNESEFIVGKGGTEFGLFRGFGDGDGGIRAIECNDISLRQWLDNPKREVTALECLYIFRQIVDVVNLAHSQGIVVQNVRPSCFVMTSFNRVSFIESASCSDSDEDASNSPTELQALGSQDQAQLHRQESQLVASGSLHDVNHRNASEMISGTSCLQSGSDNVIHLSLDICNADQTEEKKQAFPMKQILNMETNWYTSPEEVAGAPGSCASDIYRLGVLLFELYSTYSSAEEKSSTMSSLRHRVLPPQLLLKWPKEASFCLWLLHPEPTSRPKMGELLESEFLNEPRDNLKEREVETELREKIEEQELLLDFLLLLQKRKQEAASKLHETVSFISSDIEEVTKLQIGLQKKGGSIPELEDSALGTLSIANNDSGCLKPRKRFRPGLPRQCSEEFDDGEDRSQKSEAPTEKQERIMSRSSRLMKNFKKLESAYFLTRRRAIKPIGNPTTRQAPISSDGRGSIILNETSVNTLSTKERLNESRKDGWINSFLGGLCKYLSFTNLKVKADLRQGDLLNSSNLVCSLSFDRDGEFFATAGVNKKIKVFEYNTIINEARDIHYPVVELSSRSKLSSICWNGYIKSQIASSNFEGVVQIWDVTRSQVFLAMKEHEKRVWSVDFSLADPTMLASGSDDGSVKLWNINQAIILFLLGASVGTIKTKANVCCVQFSSDSGHSLAFGSADHKIYHYDLRNMKMPLCTLIGHNKTVSYIKFIDSLNLVSASTDNTLKLWDLSMSTSRVLDCPLQSYTGHLNVKNFVGLSVSDGYIATGSETNEVFVYHKAFPMPALSFKFKNTDPLSGEDVDDSAQFISSVCWRGQSSTLVAANSMGNIKLLEMV